MKQARTALSRVCREPFTQEGHAPAFPSSFIKPLWLQFEALIPEPPPPIHWAAANPGSATGSSSTSSSTSSSWALPTRKSATRPARAPPSDAAATNGSPQGSSANWSRSVWSPPAGSSDWTLENLVIDGYMVKAPYGGEAVGKSPVDRDMQVTKSSLMTDGKGIPVGCVAAGADRNDSPLLRPTLERLARFGYRRPEQITAHLDAGYDSAKTRDLLTELSCDWEISTKGEPLRAGVHWVVERTNSWHNRGFKKLEICTKRKVRVNDAMLSPSNSVIVIRRLIGEA